MRRILVAMLLAGLCIACCFGADAEAAVDCEVSTVTFTYQDYQSKALYKVFHFSDDEIWFNFLNGKANGDLVCFNADGQVVDEWNIQSIKGDDPAILCLSKVGDQMLVGCRDDAAFRGEVIVFDQDRKEAARFSMPKGIAAVQMIPTQRGILVVGTTDIINGKSSICLTEIGVNGKAVFEKEIPFVIEEGAQWYIGESMVASDSDSYYLLAKNGMAGTLMAKEQLICLDQTGETLWMEELPASFYTNDLAVLNGYVYLVGNAGDRDEYGCMINQQAAILCYAADGTRQWQQAYPEAQQFSFALAGEQNCYAVSNVSESQAYAVEIEADASIGMLERFALPEACANSSFSAGDDGQLMAAGKLVDSLYISSVE